jgi:hypothetical protein
MLALGRARLPCTPELSAKGEEREETLSALGIWLRFHFQGAKMFPDQRMGGQRLEALGQETDLCFI